MNDIRPSRLIVKPSCFFYGMLFICIAYCIFEYFFIPYEALNADEFVFARHIYEYTYHLPYRDFPPYKTVLGYYLLSIPMFFSHALLAPLFYIKDEIALINAIFIFILSYAALRSFDKKAVFLTLLLLLANQHFLIYGTDLRVDMLTSWFCLFAALCVLQNHLSIGGLLLGIAFLISQKALWYVIAINGAMFITWIAFSSSIYSLRALMSFNLAMIFPIILYVIAWSCLSSATNVIYSLFYEAYIQANIVWYMPIYLICWTTILSQGPLLFLCWPVTFLSLNQAINSPTVQRRVFIISFASIVLIQFITYKQPFPYNFVFTFPAFFLLYVDFISWLLTQKDPAYAAFNNSKPILLRLFTCCMVMSIFVIINKLKLPLFYNLIVYLPITLSFFLSSLHDLKLRAFYFYATLSVFIATGILYPLYKTVASSFLLNGHYQQTMLETASRLIKNSHENYVGGIPFFYQKDQPIDGLKNLIGPELNYIYEPSHPLEILLLPSLYLSPTTTQKIIEDFEKTPVKILINNYRMVSLPTQIRRYIANNYQHFYGSLYVYAPQISPAQLNFYLQFSGQYRINAAAKTNIIIDGKEMKTGQLVNLTKGDHLTEADLSYRLSPVEVPIQKNPAYQTDHYINMLRAITM